MRFSEIVKISRPRFWLYLLGPVLIALPSTWPLPAEHQASISILFFVYATLPANLLIYGVNDIFDYETDILSAKKQGYEHALPPDNRKTVWKWLALTNIPFIIALGWLMKDNWLALSLFGAFLLTGIGYSAPPLRTKTKPFLDAATNILYVLPGFALYTALTGHLPAPVIIIASWLWCAAMHAYSAIPDITADSRAKLHTIATVLGVRGTSLFCLICYGTAGLALPPITTILALPYIIMCLRSFRANSETATARDYTRFPAINASVGFLLFWSLILL
jgi:4-hydroxybenzoate polyprenyltransferase